MMTCLSFRIRAAFGVICFLGLSGHSVLAQTSDPIAKTIQEHEKRLQEEELRRQNEREMERPPVDVFLQPKINGASVAASSNAGCFTINKINVQGVTEFSAKQIDEITKSYLKKCLGLAEINQLIKEISNLYLMKGRVTSRAFLQPQNLQDGTLDILVVEGKLEIIKSQEGYLSEHQLHWAFPAEENKILNLRDLEQGLEQLNRLQRNQATLDIQPGTETGYSQVYIRNHRSSRFHYGLGANNSGSEATGKTLATGYWSWDDATHSNDNLMINLSNALDGESQSKSRSYSLAYSIPYGYSLISYSGSSFEYQQLVQGAAVQFQTSGSSLNHSLNLDQILYRGQRNKVSLAVGITRKESKNYLEDVFLETSSRVLVLVNTGITYTQLLDGGSLSSTFNWYRSVDWLDATTKVVSAENNFQFDKYSIDISYGHGFSWLEKDFSYKSSAYLFFAPENVIASEGLSLGGRYSVRGVEGEGVFGHRGGYWRNQVSYPYQFGSGGRVNLFAGVDLGIASTTVDDKRKTQRVIGSAIGASLAISNISADLTYAQALDTPSELHGPEHGIYASLQISF